MKLNYLGLFIFILFCACGKQTDATAQSKSPRTTPVTTVVVKTVNLELGETAVGSIESLISPVVGAEIAARVLEVYVKAGQVVRQGEVLAKLDSTDVVLQRNEAQAEVARVSALLDNQRKVVARSRSLVSQNFISPAALDNDLAQERMLSEQLAGSLARVASIAHNQTKTTVRAPVNGVIEKRWVEAGDFVKLGDPIVQIVSNSKLRAHLPFPERLGASFKLGLPVRLTTPSSTLVVNTTIREMRALIAEDSRSLDIIADIGTFPDWHPGASVNGTVIVGNKPNAMIVPEQSLVMRPAGEVVYVVRNNHAEQRLVKSGLRQKGQVEIVSGITVGDVVVVDGAGFLTHGTNVQVGQP